MRGKLQEARRGLNSHLLRQRFANERTSVKIVSLQDCADPQEAVSDFATRSGNFLKPKRRHDIAFKMKIQLLSESKVWLSFSVHAESSPIFF